MGLRFIDYITRNKLCSGCGTCISLCPVDALKLDFDKRLGIYLPKLTEEKCIDCFNCLKVCPITSFVKACETESPQTFEAFIGSYKNCYAGYATDPEIRFQASSGGLVTQLLIYTIESKVIDGAIVTRMKEEDPLKPEPFIARSRQELMKASGSKYSPVPVNVLLREVVKAEHEGEKFAIVGLPCHILGVRKAESVNTKLRKRIVLHLGLFCNHTPSFIATELFLRKLGVNMKEVEELKYRGEGWPGFMQVTLKSGERIKVPLQEYWKFLGSDFFTPKSCLICNDTLNESADISFGDAWLPKFSSDRLGTSIIITRSNVGETLLRSAADSQKIKIQNISCKDVIRSQLGTIYLKKINIFTCSRFLGVKTSISSAEIPLAFYSYLASQMILYSKLNVILKEVILNEKFFKVLSILKGLLFKQQLKRFERDVFKEIH